MLAPGAHTEAEALAGFIDDQLTSLRAAAFGLTEEQARQRPCRSELSVGGLVKHATYVMQGRLTPRFEISEATYGEFVDSFALREDETLEGALGTFDSVRATYLADVRAADPGAAMTEPPAPWDGRPEPTSSVQRFALLHHVEEIARHAGHADILREQIDGAAAGPLVMAAEGIPGNAFLQPWTPAP